MQRGDRQEQFFGSPRQSEEPGVYPQGHQAYLGGRQPVVVQEVGAGGFGLGQEDGGEACRSIQKHAPEGQFEPAEVFRMPLVLHVVKYCNGWAGRV